MPWLAAVLDEIPCGLHTTIDVVVDPSGDEVCEFLGLRSAWKLVKNMVNRKKEITAHVQLIYMNVQTSSVEKIIERFQFYIL